MYVCVVLLSDLFINDCVWQSVRCVWRTIVCDYWNCVSVCDNTTNLFMYAITVCVITVWVSITITTNELSTNFVVWADELTNCRFVKPSGVIYQSHRGVCLPLGVLAKPLPAVCETVVVIYQNHWGGVFASRANCERLRTVWSSRSSEQVFGQGRTCVRSTRRANVCSFFVWNRKCLSGLTGTTGWVWGDMWQ